MDKLYDPSIFTQSELRLFEDKNSCSTLKTTKVTPTPADSKKTITFASNSQHSRQSSKISAMDLDIQSEIY